MAAGGEKKHRSGGDGAYIVKPGSYGNETPGAIARNVLSLGHACKSQQEYKRAAAAMGLPPHGAPFPLKLAMFMTQFLSAPGDLVYEPFAGSCTTPLACELTGRQWIARECHAEYLMGGTTRFKDAWINPDLRKLFGWSQEPDLFALQAA